jgi:hypothetical protein
MTKDEGRRTNCPTVLLSHCFTVSLSSLSYCPTVLLSTIFTNEGVL